MIINAHCQQSDHFVHIKFICAAQQLRLLQAYNRLLKKLIDPEILLLTTVVPISIICLPLWKSVWFAILSDCCLRNNEM